jgi:hypothetical protein
MLFNGHDFRRGSSLDETARFRVFAHNIAVKTGAPFANVAMGLITSAIHDLKRHRPEAEAIAAALIARGELKAAAVMRVFEQAPGQR